MREWEPDVVLLDIMMPDIDGYEVCRALKSHPATAHIPVIMVTALKDQSERRRGLAVGADEFLVKPVETEILLARLRSILRLKQLLDEWRARGNSIVSFGLSRSRLQDSSASPGAALIVEDLPPRGSQVREVLRQAGIAGEVVEDEADALAAAVERGFDLIIISLSLMSGDPLLLLAKLRASAVTRDTPILLIAEADRREALIRGLDLGANDCISAPLDDAELLLRSRSHVRRKQYQDRLREDVGNALELAAIDPLTKLFNRRYLMNLLDRECARPGENRFAILMIDVDHFKEINDRFGHPTGDRVLVVMSEIIRSNLRKSDVVARYGGEEFIVVLSEIASERQAAKVAEKLRSAVEQTLFEPGCSVTISVGVAVRSTVSSAAILLNAADEALYEAKRGGRNQVVYYQGDPPEEARRRRFES